MAFFTRSVAAATVVLLGLVACNDVDDIAGDTILDDMTDGTGGAVAVPGADDDGVAGGEVPDGTGVPIGGGEPPPPTEPTDGEEPDDEQPGGEEPDDEEPTGQGGSSSGGSSSSSGGTGSGSSSSGSSSSGSSSSSSSGGSSSGGSSSGGSSSSSGGSNSNQSASGGVVTGGTGANNPVGPTSPGAGPTRTCSYSADSQGFFELKSRNSGHSYWVRLPANYNKNTPYPMVIGAHGCGDSGKNFATWAMAPWEQRSSQKHIAVSLGAGRDGRCWNLGEDEPKLLEVVDDVAACFYVDDRKVGVGGFSSGGQLAYYVGMRNAAKFAAILIENSSLPFGNSVNQVLSNAAWKIPVVITARQSDSAFNINGIRNNRDILRNHGFPLTYRDLPGGHDGSNEDWRTYLLPNFHRYADH